VRVEREAHAVEPGKGEVMAAREVEGEGAVRTPVLAALGAGQVAVVDERPAEVDPAVGMRRCARKKKKGGDGGESSPPLL
jgi:hypothetical protein